jgi:hypothetical protein
MPRLDQHARGPKGKVKHGDGAGSDNRVVIERHLV